jgi:hypothetical protein
MEVQINQAKLLSEEAPKGGEAGLKTGRTRIHGHVGPVSQNPDAERIDTIAKGLYDLINTVNKGTGGKGKDVVPPLPASQQIQMGPRKTSKGGRMDMGDTARILVGAAKGINAANKPVLGGEEYEDLGDVSKRELGSPASAEEIGEYEKINQERLHGNVQPSGDLNNDGTVDAQDVAMDASDNVMGNKQGSVGPKFTNPLAAQARLEMGHGAPGDEELAAKLRPSDEDEDEGYDMTPDENDATLLRKYNMKESISQKISRILNEEPATQKGRILKADDARLAGYGSPNLEGAPKGMFKGIESPEQKLGIILGVVRDGPEKHGSAAYQWASSALDAMQKTLRKG